ncbi:MAG: response regulator [Rhodospirillaceae bacterium]|nr:response regulator [Rhodospirillaceae bacterium]
MEVMVVEDEFLIALLMERTLVGAGHGVIGPARTGEEAVRLARRERPDLALIDIRLEDGTDGVEAARTMWERFETPSILVTAYAQDARRAAGVAIGCLHKPFAPVELLEAVRIGGRFLDGRAPAPGPHNFEFFIPAERFALPPYVGPRSSR